ncbi:MAG TPA: hypothetical protein ENG40_04570 [Thermoprotei archaeon]|nr:hypothetical protein [Thermoprotei archaeon]
MNEIYEDISSINVDLERIVRRTNYIFLLSFLGFKATFDKNRELCEIFIRIMHEANQVKYSLRNLTSKL